MGGSSSAESPSEAKDETKSPRKSPKGPSRFASVSASCHSKVRQKVMLRMGSWQEYTGIQKWTYGGDAITSGITQQGNGSDWFLILCKNRKEDIAFMSTHPNVYDWGPEAKEEMLQKNNYVMEKEILVDVTHAEVKEQLSKQDDVVSLGEMFLLAFETLKHDMKMVTLLCNITNTASGGQYAGIEQYRLKSGDASKDVFIISTIQKTKEDKYDLKFSKSDHEVIRISEKNRADHLIGYRDEPFREVQCEVSHMEWASLCFEMKEKIGTNIPVEDILRGAWEKLELERRPKQRLDSCGSMTSISAETVHIHQNNIQNAEQVIAGGKNSIRTPSGDSDSDDDEEIARLDEAIAQHKATAS